MKQLKFILCLVLLACLAFGNAFAADSLPYDCYKAVVYLLTNLLT